MKGLTYIRIRCNVSQSFLAQKLGVTRQAVNLWENGEAPPPPKRLKQLEEFFGISREYFGEMTESMRRAIDCSDAYQHEENGHTYYCYVVHPEYCKYPDMHVLLVPPEWAPRENTKAMLGMTPDSDDLLSFDDRYQIARQALRELLSSIENLTETSRYPMDTPSKLANTNRILSIFTPLAESVRHFTLDKSISPLHFSFYYHILLEVMAAIGIVYGIVNPDRLPQEDPIDACGYPLPDGMHHMFIRRVAAMITEELENRKAIRPEIKDEQEQE